MASRGLGTLTLDLILKMGGFERGMDKAARHADRRMREMEKRAKAFGKALGVAIAAGAVVAGAAVRSYIRMADEMSGLNARLRLATDGQESFNKAQQATFRIAQATGTAIGSVIDLYSRAAQASEMLGISQEQTARLTETVSKALAISGTQGAQSASVILQLSQALAAGRVQAEEFNSIIDGAPRIVQAMADHFGIAFGEVKGYVTSGKVSSQELAAALLNASATIDSEYSQMPLTVGRAIEQVQNSLKLLVGDTDAATGASSGLAESISDLATLLQSEGVREGFNTIVGGLADLASFAVKATTDIANFTKEVAESLAATVHGISADDLERQAQRIAGLEKARDFVGEGFLDFRSDEEVAAERAKLDKQIAELRKQYAANVALFAPTPMIITGDSGQIPDSAFRPKVATGGGTTGGGSSGATGKLKEQAEAIEKVMSLEEQWALLESEVYTPAMIEAHNKRVTAWANEVAVVDTSTGQMSVFAEQAGRNMQDAFADFLFDPFDEGLKGMLESFGDILRRMAAEMMASQVFEALGAWGSANSGAGGWTGLLASFAQGFAKNADGGVYSSPSLSAYSGQIVSKPTMFAFANGAGLMGEAGPEAILPLRRGTDGKLGVVAAAGGVEVELNVYGAPGPPRMEQQMSGDGRKAIVKLFLQEAAGDVSRMGVLGKAVSGRFNLQPAGVTRG